MKRKEKKVETTGTYRHFRALTGTYRHLRALTGTYAYMLKVAPLQGWGKVGVKLRGCVEDLQETQKFQGCEKDFQGCEKDFFRKKLWVVRAAQKNAGADTASRGLGTIWDPQKSFEQGPLGVKFLIKNDLQVRKKAKIFFPAVK